MAVGKTAVSHQMKKELPDAVFLDGDWCWDADPFQVTDETKEMVMDNICHLLNNFLHCTAYMNIIFCWVMHEQTIIEAILQKIDTTNCMVKVVSLLAKKETLTTRIREDVSKGIRSPDVLERSIARIPLYETIDSIKVDTDGKTVRQIAMEIILK